MHAYLKQKLSQELALIRNSLANVEKEIQSHPKTDKEEDLVLHRELQQEKERLINKIVEVEERIMNVEKEIIHGPITVEIDDSVKDYYIVGEEFINPREGLISLNSPLALELSSRNPGDTFELDTPAGKRKAKILN